MIEPSYSLIAAIENEFIFKSAVKADMGAGEEEESGITDGCYYDYEGSYVKQQREIWGDY